jgi:hypothetical protein
MLNGSMLRESPGLTFFCSAGIRPRGMTFEFQYLRLIETEFGKNCVRNQASTWGRLIKN